MSSVSVRLPASTRERVKTVKMGSGGKVHSSRSSDPCAIPAPGSRRYLNAIQCQKDASGQHIQPICTSIQRREPSLAERNT